MEKKLDENSTRILCAILYKSWKQHPTKQQFYGHVSSISQNIQVRRIRHVGHCWRSLNELINDIVCSATHARTCVSWLARTYINSVRTLDAVLRICKERWTIGTDGEKESGNSVLSPSLMMMMMVVASCGYFVQSSSYSVHVSIYQPFCTGRM